MFFEPKRRPLQPEILGQAMQQSELYDPTTAAVARTYAEEATVGVGTLNADLEAQKVREAEGYGVKIKEDEYKNNPEIYSEGVQWYDGMTIESAVISKEFNDAARKRAQIISDASASQSVAGFGVGFAAGVFEPKNLAIGAAVSIAAPVVGSLGWLGNTARRAYQMRKAATLGQKVGIGAAEGVVAGALVEPTSRYSAKVLQQDYTMLDSVFNIATSAAFGAGVPVVARTAPFIREKIAKFKGRTMDVVAAEVDLATQQMALGQRVDVSAIEAAEVGSVTKKPVVEQAKAAERFTRYTETPEFKVRFEGSKVVDVDGRPLMVYHGTSADFTRFDLGYYGDSTGIGDLGEGIYFIDSPEMASGFAQGEGANVRPSYIAAKNLADNKVINSPEIQNALDDGMGFTSVAETLQKMGYDGVRYKHSDGSTEYMVFSPDQVISAFGADDLPAITARMEAERANTLAKHNAEAIDPRNDTLIDYDAIDAMDERRAIQSAEAEAEAEIYYQEAEAEIRRMLDQEILNDADLEEYRAALSELESRTPIDALETLKLCLTRG